jgi:hypothetical protein
MDPNNPFNGKNTNIGQKEAIIALQTEYEQNQLTQGAPPVNPDVTLGDQSGVISGLPQSNTIYPG